jgi:hypothetical protein
VIRRISWLALATLLSLHFCSAQQATEPAANTPPVHRRKAPPDLPDLANPVRITTLAALPEGFPIKLRLTTTINPREAKPGDQVPFVLAMDLYYRDVLVAKEGTTVIGVVREAEGSGMFGKGSKLSIAITVLPMLDGKDLPIEGGAGAEGGSDPQSDRYGWEAFRASGWNPPMGLALAAFWWAMPGQNVKLPKDTLVVVTVDRDTTIDRGALRPFQPEHAASEKATVRIVRGWFGAARGADLYCNGIPIAHLPYKRLLELNLEQGWYRFSIKPKKRPAELFLVGGQTYNLAADFEKVARIPLFEENDNTTNFKFIGKKRDFGGLLREASPISQSDLYGNTCSPLPEELVAPLPKPVLRHAETPESGTPKDEMPQSP